ncbi:hypothetical protein, partial [Halomonas sp. ND22Bw]|uniref:hypothetical protein n=1 Tax=Halomonas sp. ND22Bw TaxID=2054178 RepID=UPI001C63B4C5
MRLSHLIFSLLLLFLSNGVFALGENAQSAKDSGMIDYNLGYVVDAIPKLEPCNDPLVSAHPTQLMRGVLGVPHSPETG